MNIDHRLFKDFIKNLQQKVYNEFTEVVCSKKVYKEGKLSEDFFFFSVLCKRDGISNEKLLEKYDWDVDLRFANPTEYSNSLDTKYIEYGDPTTTSFSPFVVFKDWVEEDEKSFELVQHFLLFHQGIWKTNNYIITNEVGDEVILVKHEISNNFESISINTKYLNNFLAISSNKLIKYYDHRRFFTDVEIERIEESYTSENYHFWCVFDSTYTESKFSRILGKMILYGFNEKKDFHDEFYQTEKNPEFIIGLDSDGNQITEKFANESQYLKSIYFKDTVFTEYKDSDNYSITESSVYKKNGWSIPYSITKNGNISVYFGDLSSLPFLEQERWKIHNIPRFDDDITEETYKQDFLAEFTEPTVENNPVYHLKKYYEDINLLFLEKFGFKLQLELKTEQKHVYESMYIVNEPSNSEFRTTVNNLNIVFLDSIDLKSLKKNIENKQDLIMIEKDGSLPQNLAVLELLLNQIKQGETDNKIELKYFDLLRRLRNGIGAHFAGHQYDKLIKEHFQDKSKGEIQKIVVHGIIKELKLIEETVKGF